MFQLGHPNFPSTDHHLATQEFDVSLSSATAEATLGSFLSILMVFLTFLITSSVSFTYSSSEAANAGVTGRSPARDRVVVVVVAAARDKNWRRNGCCCGRGEGDCAEEVALALIGRRGLNLEVGVSSVGEAMVFGYGWGESVEGERICVGCLYIGE